MTWDWASFIVGMAVGLAVMWVAALVSMLGDQREQDGDREEQRR